MFYVQASKLAVTDVEVEEVEFLDLWNGEKFLLDISHFPEKLNNFQGKTLK